MINEEKKKKKKKNIVDSPGGEAVWQQDQPRNPTSNTGRQW
jgi:hypothetical protein